MSNSIGALVDRLGGAKAVALQINKIRWAGNVALKQDDGMPNLTDRMIRYWQAQQFALGWRQLLLSAALEAGMTADEAIAICPELAVAQYYARLTSTERAA